MSTQPVIVWLRRDLRLEDNPALFAARESGAPVIPVYIHDEEEALAPGGAARWWLHHSLKAFAEDLRSCGATLVLRRGDGPSIIKDLVGETGARAVYWNRRYAPALVGRDKALKAALKENDVEVFSFNGGLIREPWEITTNSGSFYKVFTPFWKAVQSQGPARRDPRAKLRKIKGPTSTPASDDLDSWSLTPRDPDWAAAFSETWTPGEDNAQERLKDFLERAVDNYGDDRNRPDLESTSRLSPHIAFGEIGPLQIWRTVMEKIDAGDIPEDQGRKFLSEVVWRDFAHVLLFNYDDIQNQPIRPEFADFPWQDDATALRAWQRGETGYPIVDAGMRQLWQTGWMHNRVRMIVGSFLVKHLRLEWQEGERWFWDTLVDADMANNAASWQWVAGCGADAAPYFRIFNPMTQGEKFDPDGAYTRKFVPELKDMPNKYLQKPWEAPDAILHKAGVKLGETYPKPIVDHMKARQAALDAFENIRKN